VVALEIFSTGHLLGERSWLRQTDQTATGEGRLGDDVGARRRDDDGAAGE
jgi:hypothetical protein